MGVKACGAGMRCRLSLARELSGAISLLVVRSRPGGEIWRGGTEPDDPRPRNGADDETTRRNSESDGEEVDVDGGGRDRGNERAQHIADAGSLPRARLQRAGRSAAGKARLSPDRDGKLPALAK